MDEREFAEFNARYCAECLCAGVEPFAPALGDLRHAPTHRRARWAVDGRGYKRCVGRRASFEGFNARAQGTGRERIPPSRNVSPWHDHFHPKRSYASLQAVTQERRSTPCRFRTPRQPGWLSSPYPPARRIAPSAPAAREPQSWKRPHGSAVHLATISSDSAPPTSRAPARKWRTPDRPFLSV